MTAEEPTVDDELVVIHMNVGASLGGGIAVVDRLVQRALTGRPKTRYLSVPLYDDAAEVDELGPSRWVKLRFLIRFVRAVLAAGPTATLLCGHASLARTLPGALVGRRRLVLFAYGNEIRSQHQAAFRSADTVLAISNHSKTLVSQLAPDSRAEVIPLTLDPDKESLLLDTPPVDQAPHPIVLIVARLGTGTEGKGHADLIEAMAKVRLTHPTCELWIAGGGDGREQLEALAERVAPGAVRFLGFVPVDKFTQLFDACWVFAMPSRQEGFGLVYIEAMARSRPCIASSADAGGEVVADGETGIVVPYGETDRLADAVTQLMGDTAMAKDLGLRGKRRLETIFSRDAFETALFGALGVRSLDVGSQERQ